MSNKLEQLVQAELNAREALRKEVANIIDETAQDAAAERIDATIEELALKIDPHKRS